MRQRVFRGSSQQDAQEFIRCLLNQVHDELALPVHQNMLEPPEDEGGGGGGGGRGLVQEEQQPREDGTVSMESQSSIGSTGSQTKLMGVSESRSPSNSPGNSSGNSTRKERSNSSPLVSSNHNKPRNRTLSLQNPNSSQSSGGIIPLSDIVADDEMQQDEEERGRSLEAEHSSEDDEPSPLWRVEDTIVVSLLNGKAYKHEGEETSETSRKTKDSHRFKERRNEKGQLYLNHYWTG